MEDPEAGSDANMTSGDIHEYATWDAAYVLGSLSSADRREYEAHLSTCSSCREAVGELCGMPVLLGLLSRDEVAAIDGAAPQDKVPPLRPQVLSSLLARVGSRRRRARMLTWTVAAVAAAVLMIGVFIAFRAGPALTPAPPQAEGTVLTMTQVSSDAYTATVAVTSHNWGTRIEANCTYLKKPKMSDTAEAGDKLAMVLVSRDGSTTELATWIALEGVTATPAGHTSMPMNQIASVQIVSAETGDVVLQRNL